MEKFLKSRYRIGEKIGENPFSFTYKGYLMGTEVPVVIKIYKRSALNSPLINKLRPKVTKIISLDHPNIARVIDGDYGWQGFYFVREFIEGESMEDFLLKGVPQLSVSVEMIKQILSSLAVAHKENLIHGALNSTNIFIVGGREIKVTDFILEPGVRINPSLLAAKTTMDPQYMPPEQIKGEQINVASDIYSAGVISYRLLTGQLPFIGGSALDLALKVISEEAEPPSYRNREVPEYLDSIIMKMLEKDPLQRLSSAEDALESMEKQRLIFKLPSQDLVNLIYEEEGESLLVYDDARSRKTARESRSGKPKRRPKVKAILFLLVLLAIAAGLWYAFILNFINMRQSQ
jgi:serine/threonine-protein kinase